MLHLLHAFRRLEADPAGVEADALSDDGEPPVRVLVPARELDRDQAWLVRGALPHAEQRVHAQRGHLRRAQHLDRAAICLQLTSNVRHPLGEEVVGGAISQGATELHAIGDQHGAIDDLLARPAHQDQFLDRSLHGFGIPDASVDAGGSVRALLGADDRRRKCVLVLAVAEPKGQRRRAPSLEAANRSGGHATRSPRTAATPHAVHQQHFPTGQRSAVDQCGVVLKDVELAPVHGVADHSPRGRIALGQIGGKLLVLAVDRHGQHVGLDGGGTQGSGAHAHAKHPPRLVAIPLSRARGWRPVTVKRV